MEVGTTGGYENKQLHVSMDERRDDFECAIWWEKASRLIMGSWSGNKITTTRGTGSLIEYVVRSHQNLFSRGRGGVGEEAFLGFVLQSVSRLKNNRAGRRSGGKQ